MHRPETSYYLKNNNFFKSEFLIYGEKWAEILIFLAYCTRLILNEWLWHSPCVNNA
jgi:hypothetical protein